MFEIIAKLVAIQLVVGHDKIWLPKRWCRVELGTGGGRTRFIKGLMRAIRRVERFSRPRFRFLFDHRASNTVFGLLVIAGSLGAFLAPPFTGLDTLPALGVVLVSVASYWRTSRSWSSGSSSAAPASSSRSSWARLPPAASGASSRSPRRSRPHASLA